MVNTSTCSPKAERIEYTFVGPRGNKPASGMPGLFRSRSSSFVSPPMRCVARLAGANRDLTGSRPNQAPLGSRADRVKLTYHAHSLTCPKVCIGDHAARAHDPHLPVMWCQLVRLPDGVAAPCTGTDGQPRGVDALELPPNAGAHRSMMDPAWPKRIGTGHTEMSLQNGRKTGLWRDRFEHFFWPGGG